jgi:hypothetical protein
MSISRKLAVLGSATLAGLYFLAPSSPGGAWAQYLTRSEFAQSRTAPVAKFRTPSTKQPEAFALQPTPVQAAAPAAGPVTIPVVDPNSALGSALVSCDKLSDGSEPMDLPGARGDVRLDRCYRGRGHLVCSFKALLTEAKSLLENYKRITEVKYPELGNLEAICRIPSNTLATDLEKATDFNARFKALKLQYEARVNCAGSVQQSFRSVTLSDMAQAPDLLKSMIDTIEGDIKGVADTQAQATGLAEKIDTSEKAIITIQKVHRTMCAKNQITDAQNRAAR